MAEPGGSPNGLAIGPDGAVYVANSGGWDFRDLGGFTVPESEQPADYSGGRIERVDLDVGRREGALHRVRRQRARRTERSRVRRARRLLLHRSRQAPRARAAPSARSSTRSPTARRSARSCSRRIRRTASACRPTARACTRPRRTPAACYAWNVTGAGSRSSPARAQVLCGLPGMQLFDSLGIDSDGNVVVATLVTGALSVISPAGELLDQVTLPDPMVTNVCFGWSGSADGVRDVVGHRSSGVIRMPWPRPWRLALAVLARRALQQPGDREHDRDEQDQHTDAAHGRRDRAPRPACGASPWWPSTNAQSCSPPMSWSRSYGRVGDVDARVLEVRRRPREARDHARRCRGATNRSTRRARAAPRTA